MEYDKELTAALRSNAPLWCGTLMHNGFDSAARGIAASAMASAGFSLIVAFAIGLPFTTGEAKENRGVKALAMLNGSCDKLLAYDSDMTGVCDGKLVKAEYHNSRTSFRFSSRDGAVAITFSGIGKNQTHQDADTAIQPLDAIIALFKGKRETVKATGTCRFTNPYIGQATISCDAGTPKGRFAGSFVTDGQPPVLM